MFDVVQLCCALFDQTVKKGKDRCEGGRERNACLVTDYLKGRRSCNELAPFRETTTTTTTKERERERDAATLSCKERPRKKNKSDDERRLSSCCIICQELLHLHSPEGSK